MHPSRPLWGHGAAGEVLERGIVGGDHTGARAAFDGHIADGHALVHVERADGGAGVLEDVAGAAADADLCNQGEDDVLGLYAGPQSAVDANLKGLRSPLQQALGSEHHLDFAGADTERQSAERAVRRRMTVAADHRHAWLSRALLRSDDVDNALLVAVDAEAGDAEIGAVLFELLELFACDGVDDGQTAVGGRDAVIGGSEGALRTSNLQPPLTQTGEGLRRSDLVDQVQVDVNQ